MVLTIFVVFSVLFILSNCMEHLGNGENLNFSDRIGIIIDSSFQAFTLSFFLG